MITVLRYLATCVLLWQGSCLGADDAFRAQVLRCVGTNGLPGDIIEAPALVDTNNAAPKFTRSRMDEIKLRPQAEVAGIHLGMKMEQVIGSWGKPRRIWIYCDGSPALCYSDEAYSDVQVIVDLAANTVTNIWVSFPTIDHRPSVRPRVEECFRVLGQPTVRNISPDPLVPRKEPPAHWNCRMIYEAVQASMILHFEDGELFGLELGRCRTNHISRP